LLPNGQVLFAGGYNDNSRYLNSAELYDPATGAQAMTSNLNVARYFHTATLLANGKVLVAGGSNDSSFLSSAELYDPATGTWTTSNFSGARQSHTATLLPNGKVLLAGGDSNSGLLSSANLYDVGLGFNDAWRPSLSSATSHLVPGDALTASGSNFKGISEASGGNGNQNSSTNYPLLQLRRLDNEQTSFLPLDANAGWSNTSFTSLSVTDFPPGHALATIFTNGIPSFSQLILLTPPASAAALRIDSVAPPAGRTGGGRQLKLSGAFANLVTVRVGSVTANWSYTNGASDTTMITVTTPAHAVGAVGISLSSNSGLGYFKSNAFAYLPTSFTDDPLVAGVTTARAQHILELRQAVDALRAVAGLGPAIWTDPTLVPTSTVIKALHITQLRSALEDVATRLGYPGASYTDPMLGAGYVIKRVHIEELRQRIRAIAG
jgi:hypothetical protein